MTGPDPKALAVEYLLAVRHDAPEVAALADRLAGLHEHELRSGLDDDIARIAFWVNVYNAAVVRAGAIELNDWRTRLQRFRRSEVVVAGQTLSLDAIEHGLLRRSRWKLSMGYLGNPLPGRFERAHRVGRVDARIHFALNCGAASCPPIAAYQRSRLEEQLELATTSYLSTEVHDDGKVVHVPAIMLWYLGDFGGPSGIRRLLRAAGIGGWGRPIRFSRYDWTPDTNRWMRDPG